jgi:hypothetical protein
MKKKGADDKIIIIKLDCNTIQDRNVTAEVAVIRAPFFKHSAHCKDAAGQ